MVMDYFRRPALVGKNVQRTTVATVRGSVRRSEADGVSASPYFPLVSATQTLNITHQAGSVVVTLTGNALATVLADITTALGANGIAVDADGVIELHSSVAGSAGLMRVTGGTAAVGLGFQTYGGARPIEARGSQIPSSPESRLGNPYGVAFLGKGENFTAESITRGLAKVASNTDVLWTEQTKDRLQMRTVAFSVGSDRLYITPTSSQRIFVGGANAGALSASSTKKDLIPYFQLIDTATGLPAASQVVAVVRGAPTGAPPYANSPGWSDTTGKNILGQDQAKVSTVAITSIAEGRFVSCTGATFVSTGVVAGDLAEIASATNISRWSNNGYRWIIESVLSETDLVLRPMSKSELDIVGSSITDVEPILELNDQKSGLETFGTITVRTGVFAHNVTLAVRPAIPVGATYELRAAVPVNTRSSVGFEDVKAAQPSLLDYVSTNTPAPNGTISGLVPSLSTGDIAITAGVIRWNGHSYSIPASTILNSTLTDGLTFVYWDDATSTIQTSTSFSSYSSLYDPTASSGKGHLLALVSRAAGTITQLTPANRLLADAARSMTVGAGGQFATLDDAIAFISAFSIPFSETSASGPYPHFEIIIVGDTTYSGASTLFPIQVKHLKIRGVSKQVTLTCTQGITMANCKSLEVRDLTVIASGSPDGFVRTKSAITDCEVRLINVENTSGVFPYVVASVSGGTPTNVHIENCKFRVSTGVVFGTPSSAGAGLVAMVRSDFTLVSGVTAPQIITDSSGNTWSGGRLIIDACQFFGSWITTSTAALACETSQTSSDVLVRDTTFSLGNHASTTNASLFRFAGTAHLERVRILSGNIPTAVFGAAATVFECAFRCNPEGSTIAVSAKIVSNTTLTGIDTISNAVGGIGIKTFQMASWNIVTGFFASGIQTSGDGVSVVANSVTLSNGTAFPLYGIDSQTENNGSIRNNTVSMPSRLSASPYAAPRAIAQNATAVSRLVIEENEISLAGNGSGIQICSSVSPVSANLVSIRGNRVTGTTTSSAVGSGIALFGSGDYLSVSGNTVAIDGAGSANGILADTGTFQHAEFSHNYCLIGATNSISSGVFFVTNPDSTQQVIGNVFQATASQKVSGFRGLTSGNQFLSSTTFLVSDCQGTFADNYISATLGSATFGIGKYDNNTITIPNVQSSNASASFWFSNNKVTGTVNVSFTTCADFKFFGNNCSGAVTISLAATESVSFIDSNVIGGNFIVAANVGASKMRVTNCNISGTSDVSAPGVVYVANCEMFGKLTMSGASQSQHVYSCYIEGGIAFTSTAVSNPKIYVKSNTIFNTANTVHGVSFPNWPTANGEVCITGNSIRLGTSGAGLVILASCIYFAGVVNNMTVASNHLIVEGGADPGGSSTATYPMIKVTGGDLAGRHLIASNWMNKPSNLTIGSVTANYLFWDFPSTLQVSVSANILMTNGGTVAGPGRGATDFFVGSGAYSL